MGEIFSLFVSFVLFPCCSLAVPIPYIQHCVTLIITNSYKCSFLFPFCSFFVPFLFYCYQAGTLKFSKSSCSFFNCCLQFPGKFSQCSGDCTTVVTCGQQVQEQVYSHTIIVAILEQSLNPQHSPQYYRCGQRKNGRLNPFV